MIGSAIAVHRELGPGLLESAYEACLAYELAQRRLSVERQKKLPVIYRDVRVEGGYRLDLLVEQLVVVELKSVETLDPIHDAQARHPTARERLTRILSALSAFSAVNPAVNGLPDPSLRSPRALR